VTKGGLVGGQVVGAGTLSAGGGGAFVATDAERGLKYKVK